MKFLNIKWRVPFLAKTIILFVFLYLINGFGTALHPSVPLGFSLLKLFVNAYIALIICYSLFRFYEWYYLRLEADNFELLDRFQSILHKFKIVFLTLLGFQITFSLYFGYQAISGETNASFIHYAISECIDILLLGSEWIREHIAIIIKIKNPCILQWCTNDYPLVPYILAGGILFGLRKLSKIQSARIILLWLGKWGLKLLVKVINLIVKIVKWISRKLFTYTTAQKGFTPVTVVFFNDFLDQLWHELCLADSWIERLRVLWVKRIALSNKHHKSSNL